MLTMADFQEPTWFRHEERYPYSRNPKDRFHLPNPYITPERARVEEGSITLSGYPLVP